MGTRLTRWLLFFSSYIPLFVIFAVRYWNQHRAVSAGAGSLAVLSAVALILYWSQASKYQASHETFVSVDARNGDAMAYVVTYIIPFLAVDAGARIDQISLLVLFGTLGVVYVNSNLIHFNPLLSLVGYQIFEVRTADGVPRVLLTRRSYVRPGDPLKVVTLGDYLMLEKSS